MISELGVCQAKLI